MFMFEVLIWIFNKVELVVEKFGDLVIEFEKVGDLMLEDYVYLGSFFVCFLCFFLVGFKMLVICKVF